MREGRKSSPPVLQALLTLLVTPKQGQKKGKRGYRTEGKDYRDWSETTVQKGEKRIVAVG